ncbi:thioredoxin family protein [Cyclobacterium sp.]|uniref:thioredoxin family protein n=1 Tax=Cyclobacterium sp. TaxID=1966343 RepID=UPI0019A19861|nr:thioredoxin family protein [Cyclobacterium sp.]MBD3628780.1 thioredoxin family protein [Cyclobacterium sp.]
MEIISELKLEKYLKDKPAVLIYFYRESCGVCQVLYPKIKQLITDEFPEINLLKLDAGHYLKMAAQLRMLSVPGILFFMEGKEFFRNNGLVSIAELQTQISRPYEILYGK